MTSNVKNNYFFVQINRNPHSPAPCAAAGGDSREIWSEVEPRKKWGEEREGVLGFRFYFSFPYTDLIVNKLN